MLPEWIIIALAELSSGVQEIPGPNSAPRVLEYHRTTTMKATADSVPWCSSFVSFVMESAGVVGTRSAAARSWLEWGREIDDYPPFGSVVVLRRGHDVRSGHVGFFYGRASPGKILVLGGNQQNEVNVSIYDANDVLGYRWPSIHESIREGIRNDGRPA